MLVPGGAAMAAGGKMMNWFGLNIPLMVVLVCCWAAVPVLVQPLRFRQPRAGPAAWPARELPNAPERGNPDSRSAG